MGGATFRAAVIGATGYGGAEVVRLLLGHPHVEVAVVTSGRNPGRRLDAECPWLATDLVLEAFDPANLDVDVAFLAQEAGFAMEHAPALAERMRVVDLSADFRLPPDVYERYYGRPHTAPGVEAVYGLPELVDRSRFPSARIVANPGCYPTASSLALAPLARLGLLDGVPVVDAKSGVSGAGRAKRDTEYLFSEIHGSFRAYAATGHRHTPEIEAMAGRPVRFTPHLIPQARGIHATVHAPVKNVSDGQELRDRLREFYAGEPFVRVVDSPPATKQVLGSNRCDLWADYEPSTGFAIVCSVIDNLVKGASGEAVQNMNLLLGLPETAGLPLHAVWP